MELRKGDMSIFGRPEECAVEMGLVERGDGEGVGVRLGDVVQGLSLLWSLCRAFWRAACMSDMVGFSLFWELLLFNGSLVV